MPRRAGVPAPGPARWGEGPGAEVGYGAGVSTVVIGYVAKPEGEAALSRAIEEARLRGSSIVVVSSHRGGQEHDDRVSAADAQLDAVRARLEETGLTFTLRQTVRGLEPAEDLIAVAEEHSADLLVIGLRRRSPVGKLILGSNAQRVLLDAPCAVLAVKAG